MDVYCLHFDQVVFSSEFPDSRPLSHYGFYFLYVFLSILILKWIFFFHFVVRSQLQLALPIRQKSLGFSR